MTAGRPPADPKHEYRRRLEARRAEAYRLATRADRIANARLLLFAVALAIIAAYFWGQVLHWAWAAVPLLVFGALLKHHDSVLAQRARAEAGARFYERGVARLENRWEGQGTSGDDLAPRDHPYAGDLDLFGAGGLFELLCTARTRSGEETLARWLCDGATVEEIRARQAVVDELRPRLDLREDLAVLGGEVRAAVRPDELIAWAAAPRVLVGRWIRIMTHGLAAAGVASALGWAFFGFGPLPVILVVLVDMAFLRWIRDDLRAVLHGVDNPAKDLDVLTRLLARFEQGPFTAAKLLDLLHRLKTDEGWASERVQRLHRLLYRLEQRQNALFAPVAYLLHWTAHIALALDAWRTRNGTDVGRWLAAAGELEALCALAAYAYEHPDDPFPELVKDGTVYDAVAAGHPLIPGDHNVRNDVRLGAGGGPVGVPQALVVSGSNMSGKSTLLRTVGINAVLAFAGAPVHAQSLRLSPLSIGATLRIKDDIHQGTSRFYAEIRRIERLVDLAGRDRPLLFLLDELFAGTNSHDRRVGARAVLQNLLDSGAIGLLTTHDLALTELAAAAGNGVANVHFEDRLEGDRLVFDYVMRPGVVTHSNALALMRAVGLRVES